MLIYEETCEVGAKDPESPCVEERRRSQLAVKLYCWRSSSTQSQRDIDGENNL